MKTPAADELIAERDFLERLSQRLTTVFNQFDAEFEAWAKLARVRIFGSGLISGNYRHYELAIALWRNNANNFGAIIRSFYDENERQAPEDLPVFYETVAPGEMIGRTAPYDANICNVEGTAPDFERQLRHRAYYEERDRFKAAVVKFQNEIAIKLSRIRSKLAARSAAGGGLG